MTMKRSCVLILGLTEPIGSTMTCFSRKRLSRSSKVFSESGIQERRESTPSNRGSYRKTGVGYACAGQMRLKFFSTAPRLIDNRSATLILGPTEPIGSEYGKKILRWYKIVDTINCNNFRSRDAQRDSRERRLVSKGAARTHLKTGTGNAWAEQLITVMSVATMPLKCFISFPAFNFGLTLPTGSGRMDRKLDQKTFPARSSQFKLKQSNLLDALFLSFSILS